MIDDENATSSDKQAAEARMEERREELERLEPQIQQREEASFARTGQKHLQEVRLKPWFWLSAWFLALLPLPG